MGLSHVTDEEWQKIQQRVSTEMRLQMMPFVTPLPRITDDGGGELTGSGSYVEHKGRIILLTNWHVERDGLGSLTHKYFDSSSYFRCSAFVTRPWPWDLAAAYLGSSWQTTDHSAMAFPAHRFANKHDPVPSELLFLMGFAGSRSYYSPTANHMLTHGTPFLGQEFDSVREGRQILSADFNSRYHFAIPWQPEKTQVLDGDSGTIPLSPKGFSGSPVWNTRYLEYGAAGLEWVPGVARLTGVAWAWQPSDRAIFVTRIERVRAFLANVP
jgi:hypothetical protein